MGILNDGAFVQLIARALHFVDVIVLLNRGAFWTV